MRIFRPNDELWWNVARACGYATFFHTPLWHRMAEETYRGAEDVTIAARASNGTTAVLPLLRRGHEWFRRRRQVLSTFADCYGGVIADGTMESDDRARLHRAVLDRHQGRVTIVGNPFAGDTTTVGGFRTRSDTTHALRLDKPIETLFRNFSKGHRSATSQGRRLGVSTRVGQSLEDYRSYYGAYEASLRRWGDDATSRYPWRLFLQGHAFAQEHPERIRLWLAERDGRVLAGAWVFYWNRHAAYWHGAAHEEGRETNATNVLLADVIADARERGLDWFDFNPSGGHDGVVAFKRRFGCHELPFVRHHTSGSGGTARRWARKLLRPFRRER